MYLNIYSFFYCNLFFRTKCEDDGSLFNDEVNFGASIRRDITNDRYLANHFNHKKNRLKKFRSTFFDTNGVDQRSQIATIIQNPDFPIDSNEIVQVQGPSLFDKFSSSPDYDNSLRLQFTPEQRNSRLASKKYKSINFPDRRNLENNLRNYGQFSVSNNENTTYVHGQDADAKNTQIIINLTHQPKAYLYGSKMNDNGNKGNGQGGHKEYTRPRPVGPPSPGPTQPLPPVATVSPPAPVGPPSPPPRPQPVGPPSPPAPPDSLFRNELFESRGTFGSYSPETNFPNANKNYFQTPQRYQDSNTIMNPQSKSVNSIQPLAQPRNLYASNAQNNPNEVFSNNYPNVNRQQPISTRKFFFSPSSFNQHGSNNIALSETFSLNSNYAPPPESAPTGYARPIAIGPSTTYFLPAAPPSPPAGPQPSYYSPPPHANAPLSSYASPSQQSDPVQPPAPPPPTVINAYGAPEAAAPAKPSYNDPPQDPPSSSYGVPQADVISTQKPPQYEATKEDHYEGPPTKIQFHPAQISLSVIPHPITIQQSNTETLQPSKPSYNAPQDEVMPFSPTRFQVVQDPQNTNSVHYHVHLDDVEDMRALNEMFSEGLENNEASSYGALPPLSPSNAYGAPQAAPPPPPPPPPQTIYGSPMQLTPPLQPLMAPRPPQMQRRPMYGRPRFPNRQRDPLSDTTGGLSASTLNSKKQSLIVGENSKLKELLGLKCFIWCKFDQLEFANRRSDPGVASPINQLLSPRAQMSRRPRARSNRLRG